MLFLTATFFFISLTSFFFILLLLHHYRHHLIHLTTSYLGFSPPRDITIRFKPNNMTHKGATSQACAACKYQRRKCTPDCPLALYFPPDQPKLFQNAHKLFGVSNILKILHRVDPSLHKETMKSIIYQATVREKFPVHGCWEVIWQLQYQIMVAEQELQNVHKQLAMYRQHHFQQQQISAMPDYVTSQLELGMAPPNNNNNPVTLLNHTTPQPYDNNAIPYELGSKENVTGSNDLWAQNTFANNNVNNNEEKMQSLSGVLSLPLALQSDDVEDYDELHPFFDTIDDRQSYIDSKEAYESSSSDDSLKDTTQSSMEHATENALKSAAACFSLTSVNLSVS